jgi:hypothetical protein
MSERENPPRDLVEKLRNLGPEKVVDGMLNAGGS